MVSQFPVTIPSNGHWPLTKKTKTKLIKLNIIYLDAIIPKVLKINQINFEILHPI